MPPADRAGATPSENPYKGPIAFEEKDAPWFFGRDADAQALTALTVSERLVLFCAQSGAGKTSLINARLIPELRNLEFNVLPPARVSGELPSRTVPHNVYAYCALKALAKTRRPEDTLDGFLRTSRDGDSRPRVLILDQFEEILSAHPEHWQQRDEFFRQLRRALQDDPALSVLLVMREDRIAGLERYIPLVSGHLRARFRMERLRWEQAVEAIREPARLAGRPFNEGVAEGLAKDLCQMRIAEQEKPITGEFVEPVQLQVVCRQLWENLKDKPGGNITEDDLKQCGDVNEALESFYQSAIERTARESGISVTRLRYWCETVLITPTGIRAQVPRERDATGGLPNKAIDTLVDSHLIRPEEARGGIWYELAHDRLVQPVLQSNQRWAGPKRLVIDAQKWKSSGQDSNLLYSGQQLKEALQSDKVRQGALSGLEKEFLDAARTQQMRRLVAGLSLVVVLALALLSYLYWQSRVSLSRELAMASITRLESDPDLGLRLALEAVDRVRTPEAEAALHQALGASVARQRWTEPISSDAAGALALSPDGNRVALIGSDRRLRLLEAGSGNVVQNGPLVDSPVSTLAYHPQGRQLALGDVNGRILLWSPGNERGASRRFDLGAGINRLAFSPDGSLLAVATDGPVPVVLNLRTGRTVLRLEGHTDFVWDIAFSADGRLLATGSQDQTAIVWDVRSGHNLRRFAEHGKAVTAVAFSSKGKLATASQDNLGIVWDLFGGSKRFLYGHRDWLWDVAFSPDGEQLATASQDGTVRLWQTDSGRQIRTLLPVPQVGPVLSVTFGAHEGELAAAARSLRGRTEEPGTASLWQVVFRDVASLDNGAEVTTLAYSLDGNRLAVGDERGEVSLWNREGERIARLPGRDAAIQSLAFEPAGEVLAIAGSGTEIRLWKLSSRSLSTLPGHKGQVNAVAYSPDGTRLASAGSDGVAILWDVARRQLLHVLSGYGQPVLDVAFSRDGRWLATAGADATVRLWDPASGRELRALRGHASSVLKVVFSPEGDLLATASVDKTARIWNPRNGEELLVLQGHTAGVTEVAFTPNGKRLATGSVDKTIRIWEADTGRELFALTGHTGSTSGLAFRPPDGMWLATAGSDKAVRLEPMQIDDLIRLALERKPRPLTEQERRIYLHR